jgi:sec-independent protein translocase protein TatA
MVTTLGYMIGMWEILIIAALGLLVFGNRLPGTMRSLGQSVVEFKKGLREKPEDEEDEEDAKKAKAGEKKEP